MTKPLPSPVALPSGDLPVSAAYGALLASDRVNARLRHALEERARPVEAADGDRALDPPALAALRAIVRRVLPQDDGAADLAGRIDARLASGRGDGWRYAVLPDDADAYRQALRTLDEAATRRHGRAVADLAEDEVDALLRAVADGSLAPDGPASPGAEAFRRWFEDLRADLVRTYMALPSTLDRIGFSGIGAGGDGAALRGFARFGIGLEEEWEPRAHRERGRS